MLLGRAEFDFARVQGGPLGPLDGRLVIGPSRRGIANVSGSVGVRTTGAIPVETLRFDDVSAGFADNRCTTGAGRLHVVLGIRIAGLALRNGLSGTLRCDGDRLVVPLVGDSGLERLTLRLRRDGGYDARLAVQAADPLLRAALSLAGFRAAADGYVRSERGRL